jgi:pimeloyl-ACP methyl ester carboxylesterase
MLPLLPNGARRRCGTDDRFAPPAHGRWLAENLPRARLVMREGEGHFGIVEHLGEMLEALTTEE